MTELIAEIGVAQSSEATALEIALTPHARPILSEGSNGGRLVSIGACEEHLKLQDAGRA